MLQDGHLLFLLLVKERLLFGVWDPTNVATNVCRLWIVGLWVVLIAIVEEGGGGGNSSAFVVIWADSQRDTEMKRKER